MDCICGQTQICFRAARVKVSKRSGRGTPRTARVPLPSGESKSTDRAQAVDPNQFLLEYFGAQVYICCGCLDPKPASEASTLLLGLGFT